MIPFYQKHWGDAMAPHQKGLELFPAIEKAYESIYALLGADSEDLFVFTSCGAEAVNQVVSSAFERIARSTGKNHFITTAVEEAPVLMAYSHLEQLGCVVKTLPVGADGLLSPQELIEAITPRTALLSLSWANGVLGTVQPVAALSEVCQERGILLHLDCTHALGKLFFSLEDLGADLITFNGDQLHAPKGTGGVWVKKGRELAPLIHGGLEQGGLRAGPLNVPLLVSLGVAAKEAVEARDYVCTEIARLRDRLEEGILENNPEAHIFFREQVRVPHVTTIGFPGISNEALLFSLNQAGLYASLGGGNFQQIALLLKACGVSPEQAETALSFSLSRYTTEEEVERAILLLKRATEQFAEVRIS